MKSFCYWLVILLSFFLAGISHGDFTGKGHVHTLSETKQIFLNPDCVSTDSCDLKSFSLTTLVNEIWFSDDPNHPTYGNGVIMEYQTDSVAALEKYAIVQFQKGCVFDSAKNRQGRIQRNASDKVLSFGETIRFCFPNWQIDSQDSDPAYNSDSDRGRFYLLRWNEPGSYDNRTEKFYGVEKPKTPVVYMTDYPAGAFLTGTGARNVALEFKTCIYKANSVPAQARRDNLAFAKPISCFEWQNVYVYDFDQARFQTDLAAAPRWDEPTKPGSTYSAVLTVMALLVIAAVIYLGLRTLRSRKERG